MITKKTIYEIAFNIALIPDDKYRAFLMHEIGRQLSKCTRLFDWRAWCDACCVDRDKLIYEPSNN